MVVQSTWHECPHGDLRGCPNIGCSRMGPSPLVKPDDLVRVRLCGEDKSASVMMAMSALQAFSSKPRLNAPRAQVAVCKLKLDFHVNIQFSYRKNFSSCSYCIQENFPVRSPLWSYDKVNRLTINCAVASNTGLESKTSLVINGRKITVESHEDGKIHIRVDIPGGETQRTFDDILTGLASETGPVKGFRRQKGGKTSNVPVLVLLKILGRSRVRNSVIKELISTTVEDYVNKEELKVKKDLDTKESAEELDMAFEPGKDFSFSAVIELEEEELEKEQEKTTETAG